MIVSKIYSFPYVYEISKIIIKQLSYNTPNSKPDIVQLESVLFAPLFNYLYNHFILPQYQILTLGDDYIDFRIAADYIKCSTDSFPAITICSTPITDPLRASSQSFSESIFQSASKAFKAQQKCPILQQSLPMSCKMLQESAEVQVERQTSHAFFALPFMMQVRMSHLMQHSQVLYFSFLIIRKLPSASLQSPVAAHASAQFQWKSSSDWKQLFIEFKYTSTSSNCFSKKKHDAMHCRPGIVSHSVALAPTIWNNCCADFKCSLESFFCPYCSKATAFIIYYLGFVGFKSFTKLKAYSVLSFFKQQITMFSLVSGKSSINGGKICIAFYPPRKTTKLCLKRSLYLNKSPPLNFC